MTKLLWKSLLGCPAVLGATIVASSVAIAAESPSPAVAIGSETEETQIAEVQSLSETEKQNLSTSAEQTGAVLGADEMQVAQVPPATESPAATDESEVLEQINRYSQEGQSDSLDQVNSVTQFQDVQPTDWAYEALSNLVERYGCIAGYPDGTYRGNRALTRYEFAAGLNSCLQQIERVIAASTADFVTREDLQTLERLVQEFQAELATLGTRVDNLEGRVGFLEENQFSTTTKLSGEVIFAVTDEFNTDAENNTVLQDRVRLELNTSFSGEDRLVTRLAAGNAEQFNIPGGALSESTQTFNISPGGNNDVAIDWLAYYFPFGSSKVYLAATGGIHSDYAPTLNPYFEDFDGGNGALSVFASESPIYRIGGGAGGAISLGAGPLERVLGPSTITLGYLAENAASPGEDEGLGNGGYAALGQINFNLGDRIGLGATYVHGYHNAGNPIFDLGSPIGRDEGFQGVVGSAFANNPAAALFGENRPTVTNSYGVEAAFRLTDNISISGFGAYTNAIVLGRGDSEIWTYGAGVAFSDFGKEGNILGIFGGAQPYLADSSLSDNVDNVPYHVEAFYKYQVTDNISVTPGVIWITNPGQDTDNDDALIGTLRTTFTF